MKHLPLSFVALMCCIILPSAICKAHGADDHHGGCIVDAPKVKINGILSSVYPQLEKSMISPKGNFKIHFETRNESIHAVDATDNNKNGIPDFVDSVAHYMDAAYTFEVQLLGYKEPLRDNFEGPTWDVFLVQLGKSPGYVDASGTDYGAAGVYGFTARTDLIPIPCGKTTSVGYIVLDNDYSERDSIAPSSNPTKKRRTYIDTGIVALKITCFHEFHHMVQYAYNSSESRVFYEMTSTWMEYAGFPDIINYAQYVRRLFNNAELYCLSCGDSDAGSYGYSILMQFIAERYSRDAIRRMWEGMGSCVIPMTALDQALRERNSSLTEGWCEALTWFYATGHRADTINKKYFSNATRLPLLSPSNTEIENQRFTEPSFSSTVSLYPFQFKMLRCLLPRNTNFTHDTVDVVLSNNNIESFNTGGGSSIDYTLSITRTPQNGYQQLGSFDYYYRLSTPATSGCDALFLNNGFGIETLSDPYPNPFLVREHKELIIPVPSSVPADQKVDVYIFAPDGAGLLATTKNITIRGTAKTVVVDMPTDRVSSGVYIFSVTWKDVQSLGKFLVKK